MKNILYWFIEGQTHFGMPRGAKIGWSSMKGTRLLFIQIQTLPSSGHHKWKEIIDFVCWTTIEKSQGTNY